MKKLYFILSIFISFLYSSNMAQKGEEIFKQKCISCHQEYAPVDKIKENFFEKNNTLLKLKAPTVNMMHWAITKGPNKIGEDGDDEFRVGEIADFLKDYLINPNKEKSICDKNIMKFYETKKSLKGVVKEDEFEPLASYLLYYTPPPKKSKNIFLKNLNEKEILQKAKKENKLIIIEASADDCVYCKQMKKDVLKKPDIKEILEKNFVFVELDVKKDKLPFGIDKAYPNITPSFFILDKDAKPIDMMVGYIKKDEFKKKLNSYIRRK